LNDFKLWQCDHKNDQNQGQQSRHSSSNDPPHGRTFADGPDDPPDPNDRGIEHHSHDHKYNHLNLGDVIGGSGDEGRGGEFVEFRAGKTFDFLKYSFSQVTGNPGRRS
jgi:hypothetical protein